MTANTSMGASSHLPDAVRARRAGRTNGMLTLVSLLVVAGLLPTGGVQAQKQRYVNYLLTVDRAKQAAWCGDTVLALATYDSAFRLMPWVHQHYLSAIDLALALGNDARANELLIQGTENGADFIVQRTSRLTAMLATERAMPYLNTQEYMRFRYLERADTAYMRSMQELLERTTAAMDDDREVRPDEADHIFRDWLTLVKERGYAGAMTIGSTTFTQWWLLALLLGPYPDGERWQLMLPYIRRGIERGTVAPDHLCRAQDMADLAAGRPLTYGVWTHGGPEGTSLRMRPLAIVDAARRAVGLGPFLEQWARRSRPEESLEFVAEP